MRKYIFGLTISACLFLGISSFASNEYTTEDGVFCIEIPEDNWLEVESPNSEFMFTCDLNVLNVQKRKNADPAEEIKTSERFNSIFQFSYAHGDDIYTATAYVADEEHLSEIFSMINSIQIKDIHEPSKKIKNAVKEYTIEACDKTLFVGAENGVNLRKKYKTSSEVLTIIDYEEPIKITGIVLKNGKETDWLRAEYLGQTGYVSADALSEYIG